MKNLGRKIKNLLNNQFKFFILIYLIFWEVLKDHPDFANATDLFFIEKSATTIIISRKDKYFDNKIILRQFKRLFTIIRYSK